MKQPLRLLLLASLGAGLWTACQPQTSTEKSTVSVPPRSVEAPKAPAAPSHPKLPKNAVKGDFDGDGTTEYGWLVPPEIVGEMACKDSSCTSYLRFSKPQFPAIAKENCIGGTPVNLGDLNDDGGDEIGLLPEWFTSCWMEYFVYTYRAGQWQLLVKPFETHCNQWEAGVKPIEKDPAQKGFVLVRYMEMGDTTFAVRTKSVPVR